MPKKNIGLYKQFKPEKYSLDQRTSKLKINGKKNAPPSKRITLHQKKLKIRSAKISRLDKRGMAKYDVIRINHLPSFEQVRLHTKEIMYPGPYQIEVEYQLSPEKLKALRALGDKKPDRTLLPSVDEPEAWDAASIEILS